MLRATTIGSRGRCVRPAIALAFVAHLAAAAPCEPSPIEPASEQRDKVLEQARDAVRSERFVAARSLFHRLTVRQPTDQEAWLGLSLANAWTGCHKEAKAGFRYMLQLNAHDVEARVALIDVLTWETAWNEVRVNLDQGLALDPHAAALLYRQARLTYWSGNAPLALDQLNLAVHYGGHDAEVKALRRQLYLEQLRTVMRVDSFPTGYSNIYTWGMQALQRVDKFELTLGTTLYRHSGGIEDMIVDGRHSLGVQYHPAIATTTGLSVGFGAPAHWVPDFETRVWSMFPLVSTLSGFLSYALWQFGSHKSVHIFAPALAYTIHDDFSLELRWWSSYVVLHTPSRTGDASRTGVVHSIGLLGRARLAPELSVGASYTYGTQLDENPIISQLFPLRSHVASFFSDWAMGNHYGVQPGVSLERRSAPYTAVYILSAELGVYWRW